MKKLILFDWGGVVESPDIEYDTIRDCLYMCGCYNVDSGSVYSEYHKYGVAARFDNLTNEDDLNNGILDFLKTFNINATINDVYNFKNTYKGHMINNPYYKDVSEYIYSLKNKVSLGILSNVSLLDMERQNKHMNYDYFDYTFLSCNLGLVKPYKEIYEYANEKLKDYDILYLDDREINLEVPKSLGWATYLVKPGGDLEGIKKVIEEFLRK